MLSDIEARRMTIHPVATDLRDPVQAAYDARGAVAGRPPARHEPLPPGAAGRARGRPGAGRAAGAEPAHQRGEVHPRRRPGRGAAQAGETLSELVVRDTGIGIPEQEQDQLFTRFFRSSTATHQAIQGTGLGLTIVQAIAGMHGGDIRIGSVEGKGTTATARLPRVPGLGRSTCPARAWYPRPTATCVRCRSPDRRPLVACGACQTPPPPPPGSMPGPPSRRCRGTRRGPSSGARRAPVTATPSVWSAAGAAWSSRCSTSRSRRACPPTATSPTGCSPIPFRQVRERGFEAHDDGTPLVVVDIETELEFSVAEVIDAIDDTGIEFADRGGFETDDATYGELVDAIITRRDRPGRGRQPRHRPALPRDRLRLGRRQGADHLPPAARARARRLLDLPLLHRRPLPDRGQPGAPRLHPRRRRPDEPDQRHLPDPAATARSSRAGSSTSSPTRRRSTSSSWSSTRSSR